MKLTYGIMIGIGVCVFSGIMLVVYIQLSSGIFSKESRQFIEEFIGDFSENWEVSDIHGRLSSEFLATLDTPKSHQALNIFRGLGPLLNIHEFSMTNYYTTAEGKLAIFSIRGEFKYGNGLITVKVVEKEDLLQIGGFHIKITESIENGLIPKNA